MKKYESGQSIIELLAALAVFTLVVVALMMVTTISVRNATFAKNQALATKYGQASIEEARDLRDNNKGDFFDTSSAVYNFCDERSDGEIGDSFTIDRICEYQPAEKRMKVTVNVTWKDARGTHQSALSTFLSKWE